jgi:hypothetical protein
MKKELGASSSSRPTSIAELKKQQKKERKRKLQESLDATSDSVAQELKSLKQSMDHHEANKLKKEKLLLAEKYYVTAKDAPAEYRAMLKERMDEIEKELAK